jgi:hypothetical protein
MAWPAGNVPPGVDLGQDEVPAEHPLGREGFQYPAGRRGVLRPAGRGGQAADFAETIHMQKLIICVRI